MSLRSFFVNIHHAVSRIVLGRKLAKKRETAKGAHAVRQARLERLCDKVERTTVVLREEYGVPAPVENGSK